MKHLLSVDGGGIRGSLTSCVLVALESQLGKPCREIFDFVAGTSTGALIAAAIAVGLPATKILEIYSKRCGEIFNHPAPLADGLKIQRGWAFDPANIHRLLVNEFGSAANWTLNDSPIRILLTAKGVNHHPWYFVQDRPRNDKATGRLNLIDCATASAAAPVYFKPWLVPTVGYCYDGGTGVTGNPVYQACVEAFEHDDFSLTDTQVVSLGTGYYPNTQVHPPCGIIGVVSWTIDAILDAPKDQQTELVNRHYPGILQRFDWQLPNSIDMADVSAIPKLITLGRLVASKIDWKSILRL